MMCFHLARSGSLSSLLKRWIQGDPRGFLVGILSYLVSSRPQRKAASKHINKQTNKQKVNIALGMASGTGLYAHMRNMPTHTYTPRKSRV